jgi:hypothetical protein
VQGRADSLFLPLLSISISITLITKSDFFPSDDRQIKKDIFWKLQTVDTLTLLNHSLAMKIVKKEERILREKSLLMIRKVL